MYSFTSCYTVNGHKDIEQLLRKRQTVGPARFQKRATATHDLHLINTLERRRRSVCTNDVEHTEFTYFFTVACAREVKKVDYVWSGDRKIFVAASHEICQNTQMALMA